MAPSADSPFFSVVVPVYGCPETIPELCQRLSGVLRELTRRYEIILVNDACPRGSWQVIQSLCRGDVRIIGINLSRNFGQHYAITAGIDAAQGDLLVVMDCDLQDRPEEIPRLFDALTRSPDADMAIARRVRRQDPALKRLSSRLFYRVFSYFTGTRFDPTVANFGLYRKNVADALRRLTERMRFFPVLVHWAGFSRVFVDVAHTQRPGARSSYSFRKLLQLALDVIIAYSDKPLWIAVRLGLLISAVSFLSAAVIVLRALRGNYIVLGWASLMVSLWLIAGLLLFFMGILGIYIGKHFEQSKQRPLYLIKDIVHHTRG